MLEAASSETYKIGMWNFKVRNSFQAQGFQFGPQGFQFGPTLQVGSSQLKAACKNPIQLPCELPLEIENLRSSSEYLGRTVHFSFIYFEITRFKFFWILIGQ